MMIPAPRETSPCLRGPDSTVLARRRARSLNMRLRGVGRYRTLRVTLANDRTLLRVKWVPEDDLSSRWQRLAAVTARVLAEHDRADFAAWIWTPEPLDLFPGPDPGPASAGIPPGHTPVVWSWTPAGLCVQVDQIPFVVPMTDLAQLRRLVMI